MDRIQPVSTTPNADLARQIRRPLVLLVRRSAPRLGREEQIPSRAHSDSAARLKHSQASVVSSHELFDN